MPDPSLRAGTAGDATARDGQARDRLTATLERLEHVDVGVLVVAPPDVDRLAAKDRARDAAVAAGRGRLLDQATGAARDIAIRAFSRRGFSGTWAVADWSISTSGPRDRAAVAAAFEEAAAAAIVSDLVDDETLAVLRTTSDELSAMTGTPDPGALSTVGRPLRGSGPAAATVIAGAVGVGLATASVTGGIVALAVGGALVGWLAKRRSVAQGR